MAFILSDGAADVVGPESSMRDGEALGYMTSGGFGHRIGRSIALGYVAASLALDGGTFTLDVFGTERTATITLQAPCDPSATRLRG